MASRAQGYRSQNPGSGSGQIPSFCISLCCEPNQLQTSHCAVTYFWCCRGFLSGFVQLLRKVLLCLCSAGHWLLDCYQIKLGTNSRGRGRHLHNPAQFLYTSSLELPLFSDTACGQHWSDVLSPTGRPRLPCLSITGSWLETRGSPNPLLGLVC